MQKIEKLNFSFPSMLKLRESMCDQKKNPYLDTFHTVNSPGQFVEVALSYAESHVLYYIYFS